MERDVLLQTLALKDFEIFYNPEVLNNSEYTPLISPNTIKKVVLGGMVVFSLNSPQQTYAVSFDNNVKEIGIEKLIEEIDFTKDKLNNDEVLKQLLEEDNYSEFDSENFVMKFRPKSVIKIKGQISSIKKIKPSFIDPDFL